MIKFFVIDGTDGTGKATQVALLGERLEKLGYRVVKLDFPNYESNSSAAVKMYLGGELGDDPTKLNPYVCGTFYAVDRFINYIQNFKKYFENESEDGRDTVILSDRYLSANIIHQGGKIKDRKERRKYTKWCYDYECGLCGLPVEDMTIILSMPPAVSQKLMSQRYNGDESKKDIHEKNVNYLEDCVNKLNDSIDYLQYVDVNGKNVKWRLVNCSDGEKVRSIEHINDEILALVLNEIKA